MKLVEAAKGDQRAEADSKRVEDLRGGGNPDAGVAELLEVGLQVKLDAFARARQRHAPEEQDDEHHVREGGGEVDHLAR